MKLSLIYLSLFLSSCTSGTKNSPAVADAAEAKSADVVAAPAVAKPEEPEDTNYIRHVELGDYKFTAAIKGAQLSVTVQKGENILLPIRENVQTRHLQNVLFQISIQTDSLSFI
ncbi:MAG: hypothetical protein IPG90_10790 [Bacteroidetes bacterium]|nr:hypothetical protein [Bacteroidota bacterium]